MCSNEKSIPIIRKQNMQSPNRRLSVQESWFGSRWYEVFIFILLHLLRMQAQAVQTHTHTHFSHHGLPRQAPLLRSPREIDGPGVHGRLFCIGKLCSRTPMGKKGVQRQKESPSDWRPVGGFRREPDPEGETQRPNGTKVPGPTRQKTGRHASRQKANGRRKCSPKSIK